MALYDRLFGGEGVNKIPLHGFMAVLDETVRGRMTNAAAQAAVISMSGAPLDAQEITDVTAVISSITSAGNANSIGRLNRWVILQNCVTLAEHRVPGYSTPAELRTRMGL